MQISARALLAGALAGLALAPAFAQQYPTRPIRVVVSFPPGGGVDFLARTVAAKVAENLGQPVIVDNRVGGNTIVAAESVAHAPPDGYTILHALDFTMTQNPALYVKLPYDPVKDFAPVGQLSAGMAVLVTNAKQPFRTLKELVAHARANPGKLNFGASAVTTRLIGEQLRSEGGVDMVFVPYKGTVPMVQAILANEVDFVVDGTPIYVPHVKEGKMRALAVSGSSRYYALPDVPTVAEAGFPALTSGNWIGWFAPAGTPRPIIGRLNAEVIKALSDAGVKEKITNFGFSAKTGSPEELGAMLIEDLAHWAPIIKASGIKPE